MRLAAPSFWANKRVLITGHTGFKGAWLSLWLHQMRAEVSGVALAPMPGPSLFDILGIDDCVKSHITDLRNADDIQHVVSCLKPEIVIHMGAQSLVRPSLLDPETTYATNVLGTGHLLDACLRVPSIKAVLVVTSDKVYENTGTGRPFVECDPLGGKDPYSASKAMCELLVTSYRQSFFDDRDLPLVTARAGNVIGGGDFSVDRLVPDCVRAAQASTPVTLRNPHAVRPWQHVLDCLNGYLLFAEDILNGASMPHALNFGPAPEDQMSVLEVTQEISAIIGCPLIIEEPEQNSKEASHLVVDASLARETLSWNSIWSRQIALQETAKWYRAWLNQEDILQVSLRQLQEFTSIRTPH
jgi:CDP-glucose 4,6-dehydratase